MSIDNFTLGKVTRNDRLPHGCNSIAASNDPEHLYFAMQIGNRATRREAKRNLIKAMKKPLGAAAVSKHTGEGLTC